MSGDDLSVFLFFAGLAIAFMVAAVSQAGWKHPAVIWALFAAAGVSVLAAVSWIWLKDFAPGASRYITTISGSPVSWFVVVILILSAMLWINKRPKSVVWNDAAELSLLFDSELQSASATTLTGVYFYYWYHFPGFLVNYEMRQTQANIGYVMVFLSLPEPTSINFSRVSVAGGGIFCEIVSMQTSGLVVRATGDLRGRTLRIQLSKDPISLS